MQGLVVVCLIVEKIWNINVNCVTGGPGDVSCKI